MNIRLNIRSCPLCASTLYRLRDHVKEWLVVQCRDCGLVYVGNLPDREPTYEDYCTDSMNLTAPYTENSPDPAFRELFHINKQRVKLVQSMSPDGHLFDVGCGIGYFLVSARDLAGFQVGGIDVSDASTRFARLQLGLQVERSEITDYATTSDRWDIVTLWHVLEHFPDPVSRMRNVWDLLYPGESVLWRYPICSA